MRVYILMITDGDENYRWAACTSEQRARRMRKEILEESPDLEVSIRSVELNEEEE